MSDIERTAELCPEPGYLQACISHGSAEVRRHG